MAVTTVSIVNLALRSLGVARITALTDSVEAARVMNDIYELMRDEVLSVHPWNFAIVYSDTLAQNETDPEFDYAYSYALPSNCLRVISLEDETDEFKVVAGNIYTDIKSPQIQYISKVTDTSKYSPSFVTALAARLAAEAAYGLTNSKTLQDSKFEEYTEKLQQAKVADGQEGSLEKNENSSWITDRD